MCVCAFNQQVFIESKIYVNLKNDISKHDKKLHPSGEQFQTFSMTRTFSHGPDGCMPRGATGVPLDTYLETH